MGLPVMREFQTIFEEYGADYRVTMSRFLNNKEMYLRLLGMLFEEDNLQKLCIALEAGDLCGAFEAAHTLKGVVGNLGLVPLYQTLERLVELLRTEGKQDDYLVLCREVWLEFQRAQAFLEKLKGDGPV